jgi:hypothetical protein
MSQSSANINNKLGNRITVAFLTATYTPISTALANWTNSADLGHISESGNSTDLSKEELKSEDGIVRKTDKSRIVRTEGTLMQREKALLDFIAFTMDNKTMLQVKDLGIVGTNHSEVFGIVDADAQFNIGSSAASSNMYASTYLAPETAVTFTSGDLTNIETATSAVVWATSATIPANREFVIVETAVV